MNAEQKNRYFQELALNLRHEGFTVTPETDEGLLPVELDSQRLCLALGTGAVRYWREDAAGDSRSAALDRATDIARITADYMSQMEAASQLTASGLKGDYRLLADFNDVVLAGHPTKYGVQFVTWARSALFTPEQLTEVYRCIQETLENSYPITDERQKCLQSTAEQIEHSVPDLDERATISNQKELESALEDSGMHFC